MALAKLSGVIVLKNCSNSIRSNEICIRRKLPVCTCGKLSFFVEIMADKCKIMHKGCTASDKFALITVLPKILQIPCSFLGQSTQISQNIWEMSEKSPYSVSVVRGTWLPFFRKRYFLLLQAISKNPSLIVSDS